MGRGRDRKLGDAKISQKVKIYTNHQKRSFLNKDNFDFFCGGGGGWIFIPSISLLLDLDGFDLVQTWLNPHQVQLC